MDKAFRLRLIDRDGDGDFFWIGSDDPRSSDQLKISVRSNDGTVHYIKLNEISEVTEASWNDLPLIMKLPR